MSTRITFFSLLLIFETLSLAPCAVRAESEFHCSAQLSAAEQSAIVPRIEQYYEGLQTLDGKFSQTSYALGLNQRKTSSGRVYFKKPGLMDWWYEEPKENKQRFVADGSSLWFYQPQSEQVIITDFAQSFSSELPVSFLLGIGKLSERFRLVSACRTDAGIALKLVPQKEDASLDEFTLLVAENSNAPLGARLIDAGGNETAIVFSEVHYNSPIDASHFRFEMPRGVDSIDKRKRAHG